MLTKYFYITTLEKQLKWITDDNEKQIDNGTYLFSIMLLCSGLFGFVTGPIIDKFGMKFSWVMMGIISCILSVLSVIKIYDLQYVTMIGMVFNRFFYFAMAPLVIFTIYGPKRQQFMWGTTLFLSSLFNLLGYLLDDIATNVLNGSYMIINVFTGICCLCACLWLAFVLRPYKNIT